jgi:homocysteine S-methyltransferase
MTVTAPYQTLAQKLERGEVIILDGAIGTEIQRRGVAMSNDTWCADANRSHPDVVGSVHRDYVAAGAEIVTANTFATSPLLFDYLGRGDDIAGIDRLAIDIAKEAAQDSLAVAGSFSTMRPLLKGTDRTRSEHTWSEPRARSLFERKAEGLAEAGVDFIMMEMMRDLDYSLWATEAAVKTGLPVWVGIATEKDANGRLTGYGRNEYALNDIIGPLMQTGARVLSIMHTSPNDTTEAIPIAKSKWKGPLGAYPESGYFEAPDWKFVDVIPVPAFVETAKAWRAQGVTLLGGCCGIGPDHIRALAEALREMDDDGEDV